MIRKEEALTLLRLAESAALLAGHHLKRSRNDWQRIEKTAHHDIKIHADRMAEKIIMDQLYTKTKIKVFSEESGCNGPSNKNGDNEERSELHWIIDPLDGSLNYHQNIPFCCISIALCEKGNPVLGVVYDFNRDELFSGLVRLGAWCNQRPISPSEVEEVSEAVLGTGFPVNTDFSNRSLSRFIQHIQRFRKVRLLGSAALSLCFVACGRLDAYLEENIMFWDVAAGCALVQSAGGKVVVTHGDNLYGPVTVVAQNGRLPIF